MHLGIICACFVLQVEAHNVMQEVYGDEHMETATALGFCANMKHGIFRCGIPAFTPEWEAALQEYIEVTEEVLQMHEKLNMQRSSPHQQYAVALANVASAR